MDNIDHLLRRVATPRKKKTPSTRKDQERKERVTPGRRVAVTSAKMSKFPVRVVLSAFMIFGQPDAMFNSKVIKRLLLMTQRRGL